MEQEIQERFVSGSTVLLGVFNMPKFFAFFLFAAHHVGSNFYLLGRLQTPLGVAATSWITADVVFSSSPNDPLVCAIHWCLETVSSL